MGRDDRVLLFVANELERKGFGVLLDAVGQLDDPRIKILGAGRVAPAAYQGQLEPAWPGRSSALGGQLQ